MKNKIWILFSISVLVVIIGYSIIHTVIERQNPGAAITKVTNVYLRSFAKNDFDSAISQISTQYTETDKEGKSVDYNQFKDRLKKYLDSVFKTYTDYSFNNVKILKTDIHGDKASLELEFRWEALNTNTQQRDGGSAQRKFYLLKEKGSWKIYRIQRIREF